MRRGEVRWYRLARINALVTNLAAEKMERVATAVRFAPALD